MCTTLNNKNIKKIYHIGDIHIRKAIDRNDEYNQVFDKLITEIKQDSKDALIVCTGDIFHDGYSTSAIMMAKNFFINLSDILDVVVFRGNHDQISKSNPDAIDYLAPILHKLETKNRIHLLEKSGNYEYGNIIFGYTDIYDDVVTAPIKTNKTKIALWHGTLIGSKNEFNMDLSDNAKFGKDNFDGYDYVLLGDIHKHQYITPSICYCGSLIQQNQGETIKNHGYVKWNLVTKTSKFYEIKNDYGFLTIEINQNNVSNHETPPKKVNLKIIHKNSTNECVRKIYDKIKEKSEIVQYKEDKISDDFSYDDSKNITDDMNKINNNVDNQIQIVNNDDITVHRLIKYIEESKKYTPNDIIEMKTTIKDILEEIKYDYDIDKRYIKLKRLIFNNFNVYGPGNVIDYESMKGIINVCGVNGIGKSTMAIHALMYAIYGTCEESAGKYDYVNNTQRTMDTIITFDVNDIEYEIKRYSEFKDNTRSEKNFKHELQLFKNNIDISGVGKKETELMIRKIIGKEDEFIRMAIVGQKNNMSFLDLDDKTKRNYLCTILKLDVYDKLQEEINDVIKTCKIEDRGRNKQIYTETGEDKSIDIEKKITESEIQFKQIMNKGNKISVELEKAHRILIEKEFRLNDISKIELSTIQNEKELQQKMENIVENMQNIQKKITNNTQIKKINMQKLDAYDDIENKNIIFEKNKDTYIEKVNDEINVLWKKYQHTEKNTDNLLVLDTNKKLLINTLCDIIHDVLLLEAKKRKINNFKWKNVNKTKEMKEGYEKYIDLINNIKITEDNKRILLSKLQDIEEYIKNNKEICNQKMEILHQETNKIKELNEKFQKYENDGDMKKKHISFEDTKKMDIQKIEKIIQSKMKCYEKVNMSKKCDMIQTNEQIKLLNDKLNEYKAQIFFIGDDVDVKYEMYLKRLEIYKKTQDEYEGIINEIKILEKHMDMLKNHKYNISCDVCMSNDLTKDKLNTENQINELIKKESIIKQKMESSKHNCQEYEQFGVLKEKSEANSKIYCLMKEIENNINDKNNDVSQCLDNLKKKENNKKIDQIIHNKRKELKNITIREDEEYKQYLSDKELLEKTQRIIKNITSELAEYNHTLENKEQVILNITNIESDINNLNDICSQYSKYNKIHKKYEKHSNKLSMCENQIKMLLEKKQVTQMKLNMINQKISEYHNYQNVIQNNNEIIKIINDKKSNIDNKRCEKFEEYEQYKKVCEKTNTINKIILDYQIKIKEYEMSLMLIKKEIENNKKLIDTQKEQKKIKDDIIPIKEKFNNLDGEVKKINRTKIEINNQLIILKGELETIKKLKDEHIKTEKKRLLFEKIGNIISLGFVDNLLTTKIIPNFCIYVNNILTSFVKFKIYITYDTKMIHVYKQDENGALSVASKLSGYETLMANIAFRLAINNINKIHKINTLILDEIFSYGDEQAITKISYLFDYVRKMYDFVIVVSHNEQIKSYTDSDLPIQKKDGFSYVNMLNQKNNEKFKKYERIINKIQINKHKVITKK